MRPSSFLRAAFVAGLCAATVSAQPAEPQPPEPKLDVRVAQAVAFEEAKFTVTLETAGMRIDGKPSVRPFYGRAPLVEDTLTNKGFTFVWDVAGAVRAARSALRATQIYIHWTMLPDPPRPGQEGTPMLTVLHVSISDVGRVAVASVRTSPPAGTILPPPVTTEPAAVVPASAAAIGNLAVDTAGVAHFEVRLPENWTLANTPTAMANLGLAKCAATAKNRIAVTWTRSPTEKREALDVNVVVTWIDRAPGGKYLGERLVVDLTVSRQDIGLKGFRSSTLLVPPPPPTSQPASRP